MTKRDPVAKAFSFLRYMAESGQTSWSVRSLAAAFGMPVSTAHRTLAALCEIGVLRRLDDTQRYEFGNELHRISRLVVATFPLSDLAQPYLRSLAQDLEETALLGMYDAAGEQMMFVSQVEGAHPLRYVVPLHTNVPMHLGASGLAILAHLDPDSRERILRHVTDESQVSHQALEPELERIRARGYAISRGERIPGAVGLAAPIFDRSQQVIGDVVVTIPEVRFVDSEEETIARRVMECAGNLDQVMGAPRR